MQAAGQLVAEAERLASFLRSCGFEVEVMEVPWGAAHDPQALREIEGTVDGATVLANQMLALAKVEQLRQQELLGLLKVPARCLLILPCK